ncbi:MAG: DUF2141 domain-containing protein [Chlorobium sp.]|jgi:uncharacterized protein (DUF2141 family)|nr:MAG: DUF2141 domain-containing protein [Chlorobium sp.]
MKKFVTLVFVLFFAFALPLLAENTPQESVDPKETGSIIVHIKDLRNINGMLGASLYASKKGFPDTPERSYSTLIKKITSTEDTFIFENIPYGTYAISVLHDENGNGKMDKNFFGLPTEGCGISTNPKIGMGGPNYNNSVFTLNSKQMELTINTRYLFKSKNP